MITVRIVGGLGNQMFQYAAGWSLARHCGTGLCIDKGPFQVYTKRPFHLDKLKIRANIVSNEDPQRPRGGTSWTSRLRLSPLMGSRGGRGGKAGRRATANQYREPHFHFDPAFFACRPPSIIDGYFQSEAYFDGVADEVREQFRPSAPIRAEHARISAEIAAGPGAISVHVRRGDYVDAPDVRRVHGILDAEYYRRALAMIDGLHGGSTAIYLFSDDMDAAAAMLDFVAPARLVRVPGNPEFPWEDMMLMAQCRHHVIANSSFSWWGAWLDPRHDKTVIAPRQWFSRDELRRQNTCDLLPAGWIAV
ncbi:MAG TPA: alpha-1,2-fucosyltransferase [Xanthobacteraceae bacterium]|nr:alpha-1,2-fucosyltransferase [Xanthobacteraceae bacterium]